MLRKPSSLKQGALTVEKTARYYTLGDPDGPVSNVWMVCHGYSQLAEQFIGYFETLDDGNTVVVAPEALSLFYLNRWAAEKGEARKVGATWMTRENRLSEIDDYVGYLDTLYDHIFEKIVRSDVHFTALGFSQGAATVSRWAASTEHPVDRIVLWGGGIPPDLNLASVSPSFRTAELRLVIGKTDELIPDSAIIEQERKLAHHGIAYRLTRFDGGHHMSLKVLRQIAVDGESPDA